MSHYLSSATALTPKPEEKIIKDYKKYIEYILLIKMIPYILVHKTPFSQLLSQNVVKVEKVINLVLGNEKIIIAVSNNTYHSTVNCLTV